MRRRFTVRHIKSPMIWKGCLDGKRHYDKLNAALLSGDDQSVSREVLLVPGENSNIKIPLLSLEEYGFEFEAGSKVFIGQRLNTGGDVPRNAADRTPGEVEKPGLLEKCGESGFFDYPDDPGWVLPGMEDHGRGIRLKVSPRREGVLRSLDARRTLLANLKRNALDGNPYIRDFSLEDIKYKRCMPEDDEEPVPVVFLIKDVSDSMGPGQREVSGRLFSRIAGFVRRQYRTAVLIYLVHHVRAREVEAGEFFLLSRCGGTVCSSAYRMVLEILNSRFRGNHYRCCGVYFSDGVNLPADNLKCRRLLKEILPLTSRFAYLQAAGEEDKTAGSLATFLYPLKSPSFLLAEALTPEDVDGVLDRFFAMEKQR